MRATGAGRWRCRYGRSVPQGALIHSSFEPDSVAMKGRARRKPAEQEIGRGQGGLTPGDFGHEPMMRRAMAGGIGEARVAQQRERLTSASAPVDLAALAAGAWLPHPAGAAERREGRRSQPDLRQAPVADVPEFETG